MVKPRYRTKTNEVLGVKVMRENQKLVDKQNNYSTK
jgi:hypothetical protein